MKSSHEPSIDFRSARQRAETSARALATATRTALGTLLQESGGARSCGRSLGLERTLGWKLWTVAQSSDLSTLLRALPGRRGWIQIVSALRSRGPVPEAAHGVQVAAEQLLALVGELQRSPALLRAIGGGALDRAVDRDRMVSARRKARRANERVYGLHADLATVHALLAPEAATRRVTLACAAVFEGVVRSRPGMPWPIYARLATLDTRKGTRALGTPVDAKSPLAPVVAELSSPGALRGALRTGAREDGAFLEIADLPAGDRTPMRIATGEFIRGASLRVRGRPDPVHLRLGSYLPADLLALQVLVHRSLSLSTAPSAWLCGTPLSIRSLEGWTEESRLPLESECERISTAELGQGCGAAGSTSLDLLRRTASAIGHPLDAFDAYQVRVPFPPLFGSLFVSFEIAPPARAV